MLYKSQNRAGGSKNFWSGRFQGQIYVQNFAKPWCLQVCRLKNDIHYMLLFYIGIYVHLNWKISREINAGVGGKSVRQADVSGGTHLPRKLCPTGQDILSVLG